MAKETVELQFLTNAKMILGELRLMNAELHNIRDNQNRMNATSAKGAAITRMYTSAMKGQNSAIKGLALRFVGYNLILNQVMGAQQKLIEFMKESVEAFREFETRIAEVSTILGAEQLPLVERLTFGIEQLSMSYGQATSDMSKGMYDILSAAFDAENAINLLTTATGASIAGLSDIRTSVDIFTTVLNTYGMRVEQATNVSNILFQSVIRGKFQFQDLERALGYVVPIAAQAGIEFKELMASLSTTTRHGLHLDMTSRGLAMAISGIVNPTEKTTKAAKKYGLEIGGLSLRVMGLQGWFQKLNEATKEYGKSILGELIPNIRSLRVAMVLAGDVGLEGFNQDLIELAEMGDATEIALKKIMDTSRFTSNQLTQQWEKVKREVGKDWDELMLNIQRGILAIAGWFGREEYVSRAGEEYTFIKDDAIHNAIEYLRIVNEITTLEEERAALPPDPKDRYASFIDKWFFGPQQKMPIADINKDISKLVEVQEQFLDDFNKIIGGIYDEMDALGNLELTLNNVELAIKELDDELIKTFVYGFKDATGAMKEASVSVSELTTLTQEQQDALNKLGGTIKGNLAYQYLALKAQRTYADATHDVSMGLKIANYIYKEIPDDIQAAIDAVRGYTKAQEDNREATQRMTAAMRKYQIQLLELQLKGMLRRRGLTRMEEKQIKMIQIAQAKARLENMKGQKAALEADVSAYQNSKELIDAYLLKLQEEQYELKYTYDQQIMDLETTISQEGERLQTRYDWWETTNQKIIDNSQGLIDTLDKLMEEPVFLDMLDKYGIKVEELRKTIAGLITTAGGRVGTYPTAEPLPSPSPTISPLIKPLFAPQTRFEKLLQNLDLPFPFPRFQRGIEYVPETMPAIVDRGEKIIPAGRELPNGIHIDNVTIEVREIAEIDDVEKLSALLSQAESSGLMKRGKTNYRLRMG